jgi:hypothetical protein
VLGDDPFIASYVLSFTSPHLLCAPSSSLCSAPVGQFIRVSLYDYNFTKRKWWEFGNGVDLAGKVLGYEREKAKRRSANGHAKPGFKLGRVQEKVDAHLNIEAAGTSRDTVSCSGSDWWERKFIRDVWVYALDDEGRAVRADAEVVPRGA